MRREGRLWLLYGEPWGWPPATMTAGQDRFDLERDEAEMADAEGAPSVGVEDRVVVEGAACAPIDLASRRRRPRLGRQPLDAGRHT